MNNTDKIKQLSAKLTIKHEQSTWSPLLTDFFSSIQHEMLLDNLLTDLSEGIKFAPPLKEWYDEYDKDMSKIKFIAVTTDYETKFKENPFVFNLVCARTSNLKTNHISFWNHLTEETLRHASEKIPGVVVIFLGPNTYRYAKVLKEGTAKSFVPAPDSEFWLTKKGVSLYEKKLKKQASLDESSELFN